MMVGTAFEQEAAQKLPEESWTLRQQSDDAVFRKLMPGVFLANVFTLCGSFVTSRKEARLRTGGAVTCLVATIADTVTINVPLNVRIAAWQVGSAPEDWMKDRDKWLGGTGSVTQAVRQHLFSFYLRFTC